ncbi:Glycine cleavage system transcriptional activator [Pseudovibrio sp. Ad5]|uniref:LysR family transcriptional regulator n=1 Tax=Pseudovibrio sp. Ad5 TaxID=989436 RepID=UPI0007AEE032|nr:LysR family transcriptional regulator [Pseudovibrio sp. Ad5]KZK98052.1 Glycine cleavage system transcriptional activator [Pseudovibrio sp. Ad5]
MSVSPSRPKGPPLNALRAFEAAARLGGFANAAEELSVTAGAVSQHIKALEEWVGADLFERRSQGVHLTELGQDIAPHFSKAFDELGNAVRQLRAKTSRKTIHIAALPSVAQLWLSPRLPKIRAALPDTNISVIALETPPNLDREIYDLSIFIGKPKGTAQERIIAEDLITPVCSPATAKGLKEPQDLETETFLHDVIWAEDWQVWASKNAPTLNGLSDGPNYSLYAIAMEEAKNGAGILLGHKALVEPSLKKGDLKAPFTQWQPTGKSLILECASLPTPSKEITQIISLLLA